MDPFRLNNTYDTRYNLGATIRSKYPDRVPIIVYCKKGSSLRLSRNKFLSPYSITVAKFIFELRRHIHDLSPDKAIFVMLTDRNLPLKLTDMIEDAYYQYHSDDMFMYLTVCEESCYG